MAGAAGRGTTIEGVLVVLVERRETGPLVPVLWVLVLATNTIKENKVAM